MSGLTDLIDGGIDNIDVLSRDVEKLFPFYRDVLGLEVLLDWDPELGLAALKTGTVDIYMIQTTGEHEGKRGPDDDTAMAGWSGIGIRVKDAEKAMAVLDPHVEWSGPLHEWTDPQGIVSVKYRHFYDPEGNKLWITQWLIER